MSKSAELSDRALLKISGEDAEEFLNGLFTCETLNMAVGELRFGALLTPQGKILFDFFILKTETAFLIDVLADQAAEFAKRLTFYRLRKKVDIDTEDIGRRVFALWDNDGKPDADGSFAYDPRSSEIGYRIYSKNQIAKLEADYDAHRISVGMPEGGKDYQFGEAFPHEALMDQFGGVDFQKGCYVGQEVVSRMQHRGTARKRFVKVQGSSELSLSDPTIAAEGKSIGNLTSVFGSEGLGLVRLDRAKAAMDKDIELLAGEVPLHLKIPEWASFTWPEAKAS